MRLDPLTEAWTIFSEARPIPPAFESVRMEAKGVSPFAAGQEQHAAHALFTAPGEGGGWQVRVVPNRAPVVRVEGDPTRRSDGFYDRMDGVGAHEIVIEDPGDRALEELPLGEIEKVVTAWKVRMLDLLRDPRMRAFSIVKNVGAPAGARVAHSVSQLVAMAVVPPLLARKLTVARAFFEAKKRSIFEDILAEEARVGTRLVYENNGFAVFCPYAARAPFELAIYPKCQCPDFHGVSEQEVAQLAGRHHHVSVPVGEDPLLAVLVLAEHMAVASGYAVVVDGGVDLDPVLEADVQWARRSLDIDGGRWDKLVALSRPLLAGV